MIEKIKAINGLGVFNGTASFTPYVEFKQYNVIYGYNGAGKTSLSRAFRFLETKELPTCLLEEAPNVDFAFEESGKKYTYDNDSVKNALHNVRVFNSDYVWENIHWSKSGGKGIATISATQDIP
ncbi:MAG: AAA family ATPase [Alphaproteobacteria bacterium]|nr:AAA family ATPase [Alphaproteobacteria bacterium]